MKFSLQGAYRGDGARLFPTVCVWRLRGSGHKVKPWRFRLDRRNVSQWGQPSSRAKLPREAVQSLSLEVLKPTLGTAWSNLVWT